MAAGVKTSASLMMTGCLYVLMCDVVSRGRRGSGFPCLRLPVPCMYVAVSAIAHDSCAMMRDVCCLACCMCVFCSVADFNACSGLPCESDGNSNGTCTDQPAPSSGYTCGCNPGYTWHSALLRCQRKYCASALRHGSHLEDSGGQSVVVR